MLRFFPFLLLLLMACNTAGGDSAAAGTEWTERKDEFGRRERFQRRKQDFAKQGSYELYFTEGPLMETAQYTADSLDGERKIFFRNGKLEVLETYKNGKFEGPYKRWNEQGQLELEQTFVNNMLNGWSIRYYPNGQIMEKVMLKDNNESGPFYEYYESGTLKAEGAYVFNEAEERAVEQGELKEYNEQGQVVRIANCENGICKTSWKLEK